MRQQAATPRGGPPQSARLKRRFFVSPTPDFLSFFLSPTRWSMTRGTREFNRIRTVTVRNTFVFIVTPFSLKKGKFETTYRQKGRKILTFLTISQSQNLYVYSSPFSLSLYILVFGVEQTHSRARFFRSCLLRLLSLVNQL